MSETKTDSVKKTIEELDQGYEANFAGKNRQSVDIGRIEALLVKAKGALDELDKAGAALNEEASADLRRQLQDRVSLYEREHKMIEMAKKLGPNFERFMQAGTEANVAFATYGRHFAGQSRTSRDAALLQELIEDLKGVQKRMLAVAGKKPDSILASDVKLVQDSIERYQTEMREIQNAMSSGTPSERADRLAGLANAQFALYASHFAGKSRVTRRPQLLKRIVDSLRKVKGQMVSLKNEGFESQTNDNNVEIIDSRLKGYETELEEIRKVRKATRLVDIMSALGGNANELFEEYRRDFADKPRTDVSLDQLGVMLDQLAELRRQMAELGRVEKNEMNEKNMQVVQTYLMNWIREYNMIKEAQSTALAH